MKVNYDNFNNIKYILAVFAIAIISLSVYYSSNLANDMSKEERKRIELWAEATRQLVDDRNSDLSFILKVIEGNTSIPVVIADNEGNVYMHRNIDVPNGGSEQFLKKKIANFKEVHDPIIIQLDESTTHYLYYDDSTLLKQLAYYPYIQWGIISTFCLIIFYVFTSAKKAEQNRVWVGLSKETAHQLGTPISSLLAWVEILKSNGVEPDLMPEIEKDVNRLRTIAERFSKIGSIPEKENICLNDLIDNSLSYMRKRTSSKIAITCVYDMSSPVYLRLNKPLFEWVIENLCKNAIDAMEGEGRIDVHVFEKEDKIGIDVQDTGKGIAKSKFNTVFKPGYTTKKRGWGLGLSLVKRIIEEYHEGKIFVKKSEINKGTTFRILLKKEKIDGDAR
ncbi:MAG TPA: HAMP domain-containing sensor histidine kinase [Paludibacteraceae bacterium]|nr:HAMP domain-containing sensor histidine kinase [Paludibacteraceae bacterium]HOU67486.1 HAMP domain-containing sensor histidine kinase [Paludibacteraceae bacterium]HQF49571.1 HAMP domain-containing sensor histidine kinase [Paludibacteraceae bacterium]